LQSKVIRTLIPLLAAGGYYQGDRVQGCRERSTTRVATCCVQEPLWAGLHVHHPVKYTPVLCFARIRFNLLSLKFM
jgi:hypothetical protein